MKVRPAKPFLVLVALLMILAGCSPTALSVPATPTTLLAPSVSAQERGTALPSPSPERTRAAPSAPIPDGVYAIDYYKLKLLAPHYTLLTEFDQEWAQGSFSIDGNRIVFTEQDFAPECGPEDSPYSYQWSFDGKALSFTHPDDKCSSRPDFMGASPWIYKGP